MKILIINAGSSSLKYQLIDMDHESIIAKGLVERIGIEGGKLTHKYGDKTYTVTPDAIKDHTEACSLMIKALTDPEKGAVKHMDEIGAVGHRVLHGGEAFTASVLINEEVKEAMEEGVQFRFLNAPVAIEGKDGKVSALKVEIMELGEPDEKGRRKPRLQHEKEGGCDQRDEHVRKHAAQVVEPVGHASVHEIGRPHEALAACSLQREPLETQPVALFDKHEAAHSKRPESVAGCQPEYEVTRFVHDNLHEVGNDHERDDCDEPNNGFERVARVADSVYRSPREVAARSAGRHEQYDGQSPRSPTTFSAALLTRHASAFLRSMLSSKYRT